MALAVKINGLRSGVRYYGLTSFVSKRLTFNQLMNLPSPLVLRVMISFIPMVQLTQLEYALLSGGTWVLTQSSLSMALDAFWVLT